jgi:hypothetical protein
MARWFGLVAATALAGLLLAATGAVADPDELMPCKILIIKAPSGARSGLTKFTCKGTFALPSAAAAPTGLAGGLLVSVDTVPPGNIHLSGPGGPCTGFGSPPGSKGYNCRRPAVSSIFPIARLRANVVKVVAKLDYPLQAYSVAHPYTGDVAIKLTSYGASDQKRYCARFPIGSALRNDSTTFEAKDAPAPTACSPSGAFLDASDTL